MNDVTNLRARLFADAGYRGLSAKRRKLASAIILDGASFSPACRALGLNQTRESACVDLQVVLAAFRDPDTLPIVDQSRKGLGFDSDADEVFYAYTSCSTAWT